MTRTLHSPQNSDSSSSSSSSERHRQSKRNSLSRTSALVALEDTISLNDPNIILPQRSIERRRTFQKLLQRYNAQLLYGCLNPKCSTKTCMTYQKRTSKGPFRPYTALSARTLATFLASQDHPERGLCPHAVGRHSIQSHDKQPSSVDNAEVGSQETLTKTGKEERPSQEDIALPNDEKLSGSASVPGVSNRWPLVQKLHASFWGGREKQEPTEGRNLFLEAEVHETKDPKSFAQNVFDTLAMKSLHSRGLLAPGISTRGLTGERTVGDANESSKEMQILPEEADKPRTNSNQQRDNEASAQTEKEQSMRLVKPSQHSDGVKDAHDIGVSPVLVDKSKENLKEPKASFRSTNGSAVVPRRRSCSYKDSQEVTESESSCSVGNSSPHKSDDGQNEDLKISPVPHRKEFSREAVTLNGDRESEPNHTSPCDTNPITLRNEAGPSHTSQSLRFLSAPLINAFIKNHLNSMQHNHEQQHLLLQFGRTENPLSPVRPGSDATQSVVKNFELLNQSVIYVCSTWEALLRSYLEVQYHEGDLLAVASSFHRITTSFKQMLRVGIQHSTLLSSLWTGTEKVFVLAPHVAKHDSSTISNHGTRSSPRKPIETIAALNDTEAAHIVKVIFAGLNSTLPKLSRDEVEAVQRSRVIGLTSAYAVGQSVGISATSLKTVQSALDGLEDELAVSLITRLCKALASRHYSVKTPSARPAGFISRDDDDISCQCSSFMTLVVRNLLDDINLEQVVWPLNSLPSLHRGLLKSHSSQKVVRIKRNGPGIALVVEWLRTVVLREWNCQAEIARCSAADGALELLGSLYNHCSRADLPANIFYTPLLYQRLDYVQMPVYWANNPPDFYRVHILYYPFLFTPSARISYFRAINHDSMNGCFEKCLVNSQLLSRLTNLDSTKRGEVRVSDRLLSSTNKYLVLEIRRGHVLTDAMNYLWRCHPSELMKPLKIRMGMDGGGEEGLDYGGVQQEFFRIALAEALDPQYGAFSTDQQTRMSWFQPLSLEPLYKFELIGLLISLAIYNGLTLPVTFPLALYSQLVGIPVASITMIEDGWPELAKGLTALRDWTDGDVADIFLRTYTFSLDVFGSKVDIDMDARRRRRNRHSKLSSDNPRQNGNEASGAKFYKLDDTAAESDSDTTPSEEASMFFHASSSRAAIVTNKDKGKSRKESGSGSASPAPSTECQDQDLTGIPNYRPDSPTPNTPMVTNANRNQYIDDYIRYLTYTSVAPQLSAFKYGFQRCLNRKSLTIFDPLTLKALIEGHEQIDTHQLEKVTKYEGYFDGHQTVQDFWTIVHAWSDGGEEGQSKVRRLLEFVTASDRLPVGGVDRISFMVQKNGVGDERLPTSLTCFGRLLLPEYSGPEALRRGLERAIEEAKGFGNA